MRTKTSQFRHVSGNSALLCASIYSCSPPLPLPKPPKYCGLRLAVSNTPAVINTPAISKAWAMALMPNTTMLPIHMLKIIHHIHASICIIRCRVFVSGIWRSGLYLLSMISLYALVITWLHAKVNILFIYTYMWNAGPYVLLAYISKGAIHLSFYLDILKKFSVVVCE